MTNHKKRADGNQNRLVKYMRKRGASIAYLHTLGEGVPDILAGIQGMNFVIEFKTAAGSLTDRQERWHASWKGTVDIIKDESDVDILFDRAYNKGKSSLDFPF